MNTDPDILAGANALRRGWKKASAAVLGRPFLRRAARRMVIYYEPNAISFTQIYPFIYYKTALQGRFDLQLRCYPNTDLVAGRAVRRDEADVVLFQTWFTIKPDELETVFARLREANPKADISFIDSFAHSDVRLAAQLEPEIAFYLKKCLFRDHAHFFQDFRGDTNLTEYYSDLYGIEAAPKAWHVPDAIVPKLRLSPNFFTSPRFLNAFGTKEMPPWEGRDLDIQTRFGMKGTPWYQAMRQDAMEKVKAIPGLTLSPPERVGYAQYMEEMRRSKICFSPHGYGELCWRDVEAVLAGAVLIKPQMDHLETLPDIYRAGETYLPVKWDFSDLEEVVQRVLADEALCRHLTSNAYETIAAYVKEARFVDDVAFLFT